MSLAAEPLAHVFQEEVRVSPGVRTGAQSLLGPQPQRPNYPAQIGAALVYALFLGSIVTLGFKTNEAPVEEQQVMELVPIPVDEQPEEDTPPPPEALDIPEPPPPLALDPIAPIEEKPKPIEKPKPVEKKIEREVKPAPRHEAKPATPRAAAAAVRAPAVRAPAAPPGATPSAIANQFHACMQRAASAANYELPRVARVSYHATFSASGSLTSYSISPSGVGPADAIAARLGGRCGSVAAPGKPVSLSGSISFSP